MDPSQRHVLLPERKIEEALSALHRSVSACQFYPANHPQLAEALQSGYRAWTEAASDDRLAEPGLEYRSGGLWLGEARLGSTSPAVGSLARVVAGHGLVRIRRTGVLTAEGYGQLVTLLATAPTVLGARGGLVEVWRRSPQGGALELQGVRVTVDDAGALARPRQSPDGWGDGLSKNGPTEALADPNLLSRLQAMKQRGPRERRVFDLLLRLGRTDDITRFLDLLREINRLVEAYLDTERFREAYHIVLYLFREAQNFDALGEEGRRDYLVDTVRMLVRGDFLGWLIRQVATSRGESDVEVGEYVLRALGPDAVVPLLNALVAERSRLGRRRIVDVLVSIGSAVVPWAVRLLEDQRWFVVRNMVTILGGVGSSEAVRAVLRLVADPDSRIRREVARALGRVRGARVEENLRDLLRDPDPAVRIMAVSAAANHGSPRMLAALWELYGAIPIRSPDWDLKPVILQAIGRTGIRDAVRPLAEVVGKRPLFQRERWRAVQRAAVQALGDLGGDEARAVLEGLDKGRDPETASAVRRALAAANGRENGA